MGKKDRIKCPEDPQNVSYIHRNKSALYYLNRYMDGKS